MHAFLPAQPNFQEKKESNKWKNGFESNRTNTAIWFIFRNAHVHHQHIQVNEKSSRTFPRQIGIFQFGVKQKSICLYVYPIHWDTFFFFVVLIIWEMYVNLIPLLISLWMWFFFVFVVRAHTSRHNCRSFSTSSTLVLLVFPIHFCYSQVLSIFFCCFLNVNAHIRGRR